MAADAGGGAPPGGTAYPGPSGTRLASFPPKERWDDWVELDSRAWPERVERRSMLVPTTCFNCESACGLLAYVDPETMTVRKFEGNPEHPGSRGRNCAKGPATLNQITDPGPDPAPAPTCGRPRRGSLGAGELGRGARGHRRPDPGRDHGRSAELGHVPRRASG